MRFRSSRVGGGDEGPRPMVDEISVRSLSRTCGWRTSSRLRFVSALEVLHSFCCSLHGPG